MTAPLSAADRSKLRRLLIKSGQATRGLDDAALIDAAGKLEPTLPTPPTALDDPEPTPAPMPEPAATRQRRKRKPASKPEPVLIIEDDIIDSPMPAPPAAPQAPTGDDIAAAINAAIQAALATAKQAPTLDEGRIIELIQAHSVKTHHVTVHKPEQPTITIDNVHAQLPNVVKALSAKLHVLMVGPAGSGKSTIAEQAADALGVEFHSIGALHFKHELTGYCDANGKFHATPLYKVCTQGGLLFLDELDAGMANPLVAFNQLLANGVYTFPNGEQVTVHEDAYFVAAANTRGTGATRQYVGRNALDGTTLDRYVELHVDYDEDLEMRLTRLAYKRHGGEDDNVVIKWLAMVRGTRQHAAKNNWPALITPRASIHGATLLAVGFDWDQTCESLLYRHLSDDQRRQLGAQS